MSNNGIVYVTQNLVNSKIYVGIHTLNQKDYLGSGKYLLRAMKKYGRENFRRIDVDEFDSIEIGLAKERLWIQEMNSRVPNGYNLCAGGEGVFNPCKETRTRKSVSMRGKSHSDKTKRKMSMAHRGHPVAWKGKAMSEEHKAKISATLRGIPKSDEHKAKMSMVRRGVPRGEETKRKISVALSGKSSWNKGKPWSEETKRKMSIAKIGKPSPKTGHHYMKKIREGELTLQT